MTRGITVVVGHYTANKTNRPRHMIYRNHLRKNAFQVVYIFFGHVIVLYRIPRTSVRYSAFCSFVRSFVRLFVRSFTAYYLNRHRESVLVRPYIHFLHTRQKLPHFLPG